MNNQQNDALSRRNFLKNSTLVTAGAAVAANFPFVLTSKAADDTPINVAIIGLGGRGRGAGANVLASAKNVKIVAIADIFPEAVEAARAESIYKDVPAENCFSGIDSYKKALAVPGVNYAILAAPPGFRPGHLRAAVEAGKNVFMEKPVAVDAPGVRSIIESGEMAKKKGLAIVAGTQRRHQPSYMETIKRIQDGALGDILFLRAYWNQGSIWHRPEDPSKSEMERAIRNWYHYRWISGDHIVEQHMHNIDVCNWAMGDQHPIKAYGQGGRQHLGDKSGHIWDHFAVEFEYENGARMFSQCRQISGTDGRVAEAAHGTKGESNCENWIKTKEARWRFPGRPSDAYTLEHTDLINSIRSGKPLNEAKVVAESTLTAIMGREAAYSGVVIEWDQMFNSNVAIFPEKIEWGPAPKLDMPIPGKYKIA